MKIQPTGQIVFDTNRATLELIAKGKMPGYKLMATIHYPHDKELASHRVTVELIPNGMKSPPRNTIQSVGGQTAEERAMDYFFREMGIKKLLFIEAIIEGVLVHISYYDGLNGLAVFCQRNEKEIANVPFTYKASRVIN